MIEIKEAYAGLNDREAMAQFLAPIPDNENIIANFKLGHSGRGQMYHKKTRTAFYIASDGEIVCCYSVNDISAEDAARIGVECDEIREWSAKAFRAAVERSIGQRLDSVH